MDKFHWRLSILGGPCTEQGDCATHDECIAAAWKALRARSDYSSILALTRSGIGVDVIITPPKNTHPLRRKA